MTPHHCKTSIIQLITFDIFALIITGINTLLPGYYVLVICYCKGKPIFLYLVFILQSNTSPKYIIFIFYIFHVVA